jgi:hypothetical protein
MASRIVSAVPGSAQFRVPAIIPTSGAAYGIGMKVSR